MARSGRNGPVPAPRAVKVLRGDRPSRISTDEPQPLSGDVARPVELSPAAAEVWAAVVPHLSYMGVLAPADAPSLAQYCEAVVRAARVSREAAGAPPLIEGAEGHLVRNPLYALARDASSELRMWAREFGLTPSARSGIHITHHKASDADPGRLLTGTEG
jgi:P27 family predicted phage terminase small subunit